MKGKTAIQCQFKHVACVLLALHLLNCSIDPKDTHPDSVPEDLRINDLETVTEFVAEEILGFKGAFAEHDEDDAEARSTFEAVKFYFNNSAIEFAALYHRVTSAPFVLISHLLIPSRCSEVTSPPPQA